jgi:hypothetical protein
MGRLAIEDMLNHTDVESALHWHLVGNHFPPIHEDFHPAAKQAIEFVNNHQPLVPITLPNGIIKTAREIVAGLHLESFLEDHCWDDDYEYLCEVD